MSQGKAFGGDQSLGEDEANWLAAPEEMGVWTVVGPGRRRARKLGRPRSCGVRAKLRRADLWVGGQSSPTVGRRPALWPRKPEATFTCTTILS